MGVESRCSAPSEVTARAASQRKSLAPTAKSMPQREKKKNKKEIRSAVTFHQPELGAAPATGSRLGTVTPRTAAPQRLGGTQGLVWHPLAVPQPEPASPSRRYNVKSGHPYPGGVQVEGKRLSRLAWFTGHSRSDPPHTGFAVLPLIRLSDGRSAGRGKGDPILPGWRTPAKARKQHPQFLLVVLLVFCCPELSRRCPGLYGASQDSFPTGL